MNGKKKNINEIEVALLPVPNIIVLPKTSVSFYLQDERYIKMIREVVKKNEMVVLAMTDPVRDEKGQVVPQALLPRAVSVLVMPSMMEEEPNGLHHGGVIMRGMCKVKITKIVQTSPILVCRAIPLEDDLSFYDFYQNQEFLKLKTILANWIVQNVDSETLKRELLAGLHSPENVINHLTLLLVECRESRQLLLETLSLHDRFEMLGLILRRNDDKLNIRPVPLQTLREFFSPYVPSRLVGH